MKATEFQKQIDKMTNRQKNKFREIHSKLMVQEISMKEFKTKTQHKNAMSKIYEKTIEEYLKYEDKNYLPIYSK